MVSPSIRATVPAVPCRQLSPMAWIRGETSRTDSVSSRAIPILPATETARRQRSPRLKSTPM